MTPTPLSILAVFSLLAHFPLAAQETVAPSAPSTVVAVDSLPVNDLDGKPIATESWKGKTIVLEWLDIQCPCTSRHYNAGNMQKVQAEATQAGVVWVSLFSNTAAECRDPGFAAAIRGAMNKWAAQPGYMAADADAAVARRFQIDFSPAVVIITPGGKVGYRGVLDSSTLQGETTPEQITGATSFIRQALADIKAGSPVRLPQTPLMGCALKGLVPAELPGAKPEQAPPAPAPAAR